MNLEELAGMARKAAPGPVILVINGPYPRGFPRGELLCDTGGRRVYRFRPEAILRFCKRHGVEEGER